jgi:hypothetical protein
LNFGRRRTSFNSSTVSPEAIRTPLCLARSNARRGVDPGSNSALTMTLVSTTIRKSVAMQQRFQTFRRQAPGDGPGAHFVHDLVEGPSRSADEFAQPQVEQQLQFAAFLKRRLGEGLRGFVINAD